MYFCADCVNISSLYLILLLLLVVLVLLPILVLFIDLRSIRIYLKKKNVGNYMKIIYYIIVFFASYLFLFSFSPDHRSVDAFFVHSFSFICSSLILNYWDRIKLLVRWL